MSLDLPVPETRVLAIASHVVYGYVGNKMAAFVMQSMGCEVSTLNTVQFSNHTGYGQVKGTKVSATEISDLHAGLKQSGLDEFDMMLSGYIPGAAAVDAVGSIARDLKLKATMKPGSFFWVLDPVMGDNERLYVAEDVIPAYKNLIRSADLILPNQYETEWLSGVKIVDMKTLVEAITVLHTTYHIPHIVVTSVRFPGDTPGTPDHLTVVGSTILPTALSSSPTTSRSQPVISRLFRIDVPSIDCFFSGTGDMFAALMVVRFREAVSKIPGLGEKDSWVSDEGVGWEDLPLKGTVELVLASMNEVLVRTKVARDEEMGRWKGGSSNGIGVGGDEMVVKRKRTKAAEVRLVRNLDVLKAPEVRYRAERLDF